VVASSPPTGMASTQNFLTLFKKLEQKMILSLTAIRCRECDVT
jgi:hypothetical protein